MPQLIDIHGALPEQLSLLTLAQAHALLGGDRPDSIPFIVWLLENPDSPLALPGEIHLREHDYLHLLLGRGFSADDEAYVIGFTMGNALATKRWHIWLYKVISVLMYPPQFRFTAANLQKFDLGFVSGRKLSVKNLNKLDFTNYHNWEIWQLREGLKIVG